VRCHVAPLHRRVNSTQRGPPPCPYWQVVPSGSEQASFLTKAVKKALEGDGHPEGKASTWQLGENAVLGTVGSV
jgi:hypothetical protein